MAAPRFPDDILQRMKDVSIEEGWAVCRRYGFNNQFEGNWVTTQQDPVLVGRALTAYFLPVPLTRVCRGGVRAESCHRR